MINVITSNTKGGNNDLPFIIKCCLQTISGHYCLVLSVFLCKSVPIQLHPECLPCVPTWAWKELLRHPFSGLKIHMIYHQPVNPFNQWCHVESHKPNLSSLSTRKAWKSTQRWFPEVVMPRSFLISSSLISVQLVPPSNSKRHSALWGLCLSDEAQLWALVLALYVYIFLYIYISISISISLLSACVSQLTYL